MNSVNFVYEKNHIPIVSFFAGITHIQSQQHKGKQYIYSPSKTRVKQYKVYTILATQRLNSIYIYTVPTTQGLNSICSPRNTRVKLYIYIQSQEHKG